MIKKRIIFYVGGYDPQSPSVFFRHLDRQLSCFEGVWSSSVAKGDIESIGDYISRRRFTSRHDGCDESTITDFYFLASDDIVSGDYHRHFLVRLFHYLWSVMNYFISGTFFSYMHVAWRYSVYFLYPLFVFFLTCLFSFSFSYRLLFYFDLSLLFSPFLFILFFFLIKFFIWNRFYIMKAMETWTFSLSYVLRTRSDVDDRLDILSSCMSDVLSDQDFDEMLLIGHSMGGAFLMDSVSRCLDSFVRCSDKRIIFLTVGSTVLKVGLHPSAEWFRRCVSSIFSHSHLSWIEYQCHLDLISFYKVDAAMLMGLSLPRDIHNFCRPHVCMIRFSRMWNLSYYLRNRLRLFRIHYQFVYSGTRKYHYDFCSICFGPSLLFDRVKYPDHFNRSLLPPVSDKP